MSDQHTKRAVTALISMPWANLHMPSIQIGTLKAVLERDNLPVYAFSMYLHYMEFLRRKAHEEAAGFSIQNYYTVADWSFLSGMGDWIFAGAPYHDASQHDVDAYIDFLKPYLQDGAEQALLFARRHTSEFLEQAALAILNVSPDIVGFTSTFSQNVPSLALAKVLKEKAPDVTIVFGGANCEGIMGEALIRSFPWIDFVVRGEGEHALPQLVHALEAGDSFAHIPGLCYRIGENVYVQDFKSGAQVAPDDIPQPDYDEYFSVLERASFRKDVDPNVRIPIESSRGCWWGEKHHCTFCGLNGLAMTFRSKSSDKFLDELLSLSSKYARTSFHCADNILDMRYFNRFLPSLVDARERGYDFKLFYETKANLKKEHVALLAAAGVDEIQPGIESLSTNILEIIGKGVTALQNIQLLKWAREYKISVEWNLLYGLPGETDDDWNRVHDLIPLLNHLEPPSFTALLLERFSPYFDRPQDYQLNNRGPKQWYKFLYPIPDETIRDLVYYFDYHSEGIASPDVIVRVGKRLSDLWNDALFHKNASTLTYTRGPGFVKISDRRYGMEPRDMVLRGLLAEVFLRCDAIATARSIAAALSQEEQVITRICERLCEMNVLLAEGGRYLALPTSVRPVIARAAVADARPAHLESERTEACI